MRLKRIEMFGFKSFADKTKVEFDEGLTVIVGPNGCGKSNVVDGVKWVLGEQSVSSLRGKEMADVIFNGTSKRHALGYAEVSLLIDNSEKTLPVDFTEVRITRRVYRSGESEYFTNKRPCRLKDLKEMFMDTGLGSNSYAILEQGKITSILQANPVERRVFFEEAAGISKYKAKRKETMRRLERVEENLTRLTDVTGELDRQLGSIKRQAAKARRYKEMADRLKHLKVAIGLKNYKTLTEALSEIHTKLTGNQDQLEAIQADIASGEADVASHEADVLGLDTQIQTLEKEGVELNVRLEHLESTINESRSQIAELEGRRADHEEALGRYGGEIEELSTRLNGFESNAQGLRDQKADYETRIQESVSTLERMDQEDGEARQRMENLRRENLSLVQGKSDMLGRISNVDTERKNAQERVALVKTRQDGLVENESQTQQKLDDETAVLEGIDVEVASLGDTLETQNKAIFEARSVRDEALQSMNACKRALVEKESKHRALEDMDQAYEGLYGGVKAVLLGVDQGQLTKHGHHGLVADVVSVQSEYETAIETALGARGQNLIVESTDLAKEAVAFLKKNRLGRATFVPLDSIRVDHIKQAPHLPGVIGRAADLVNNDSQYDKAVEYLLGRILVVKDLDSAIAAGRSADGFSMVTLEGEQINPRGAITGGSKAKNDGGILHRKNEIKRLSEAIATDEKHLADREKTYLSREDALEAEQAKLETLKQDKQALETRRYEAQSKANRYNETLAEIRREIETLQSQTGDVDQQLATLANETERLKANLTEMEARHTTVQGELDATEASLAERVQQRRDTDEALTALRVEQASVASKLDTLEEDRQRLADALNEKERMRDAISQEQASRDVRIEELRTKIDSSESAIQEMGRKQESTVARVRELTNQRSEIQEKIDGFYASHKDQLNKKTELEKEVSELRVKEGENNVKLQSLNDSMRETFGLDIGEVYKEADFEELDWQACRREVKELDGSIRRLGPVNMEAIEEEQQLQERFDFLTEQADDLNASKNQLMEVITKINTDSRDLFATTFATIQENFGVLFRKFFGGGKAELVLEGDDVLEAGIDIMVKPPGKEPSTMNLLSGGEKTMTTVALLFAIYRSKPSPFCILDEVDAPLDEANIDRFINVLKEFVDNSQFLVVSHNKRTIGMADSIYGVTMQERGVSRVVSMKYEEAQKTAELAAQAG